ncbi:MAG: peptidoglycan-binding protein [Candidatus Sulfopaludibacter sp.]|nr:peptidoglycan-binding protein [Candidatus Sulfopaludibacter sp.]
MPTYIVQDGDCLASIAKQAGFADWHTIYDDSHNADFRKLRPDPNVICPGDQLFIPDKDVKTDSKGTDTASTFQLAAKKTFLKVRLKDEKGAAFSGKKFSLKIGGKVTEGVTGADGLVQQEIAADTRTGQLTVFLDDDTTKPGFIWDLKVGGLDPVDTDKGVQARLNNLGFFCGTVDGVIGPKTKAALSGFQSKNGLTVSGDADSATRDKLRQLHDLP